MNPTVRTPELVLTRGLPAAGKTTYARAWVAELPDHRIRVNRADIRHMLHGAQTGLSRRQETVVSATLTGIIQRMLASGMSVVVDDMNLPEPVAITYSVMARRHKARFSVVNVVTPVEVCIARDRVRANPVGADKIRGMQRLRDEPWSMPSTTVDGTMLAVHMRFANTCDRRTGR